jgi:hypothetical protein
LRAQFGGVHPARDARQLRQRLDDAGEHHGAEARVGGDRDVLRWNRSRAGQRAEYSLGKAEAERRDHRAGAHLHVEQRFALGPKRLDLLRGALNVESRGLQWTVVLPRDRHGLFERQHRRRSVRLGRRGAGHGENHARRQAGYPPPGDGNWCGHHAGNTCR